MDIVTLVVVYNYTINGKSHILILWNTLYIPSIDTCLIHPVILRLASIKVNEYSKFLSEHPLIKNHSIYLK